MVGSADMDKKQMMDNPLGIAKIGGLLQKFAVPSIVAMLVGALYNIVDQFFIGQSIGEFGKRTCIERKIVW